MKVLVGERSQRNDPKSTSLHQQGIPGAGSSNPVLAVASLRSKRRRNRSACSMPLTKLLAGAECFLVLLIAIYRQNSSYLHICAEMLGSLFLPSAVLSSSPLVREASLHPPTPPSLPLLDPPCPAVLLTLEYLGDPPVGVAPADALPTPRPCPRTSSSEINPVPSGRKIS